MSTFRICEKQGCKVVKLASGVKYLENLSDIDSYAQFLKFEAPRLSLPKQRRPI